MSKRVFVDWTSLKASRGKETREYHERRDLTIITFPKDQGKGLGEKIDFEGKGNKEKGGMQWETKARRIRTRAGNRR
jgi:hypothetical protein